MRWRFLLQQSAAASYRPLVAGWVIRAKGAGVAELQNNTKRVKDIVREYRQGKLVIPEFQRDYVWKPAKAPTLIDSLYKRWPVSSLLIWESEESDVEARRPSPTPVRGATRWLIDGQQRVITLSRVQDGDEGIEVVFNAKKGEFLRPNAATRQDRSWVSVHEIWDDESFRRLMRDVPETPHGRREAAAYERVRSILEYEVPVVEMLGHQFTEAVEAFTRINTLGTRLKKQDIESAQVAAKHSGFIRTEVAPFLRELHQQGYERLNVMHLFRACAFIAHPDARNRTPLHELSRKEVDTAWDSTKRATKEALGIVRSELGLVDMSVLWSGALLVPVIAMCARLPPKSRNGSEMAGWLALAALHHRYSGSSETALDEDLRCCRSDDPIGALRRVLKQRYRRFSSNASDFDRKINDRSALLAAWVACKQRGAVDVLTGTKLLLQPGIDRHHILPRARFEVDDRTKADTIANIAFVSGGSNRSIGDDHPGQYIAGLKVGARNSQCIPDESRLWSVEKSQDFWDRRRTLLSQAFNEFLNDAFADRRG
jgi:hypothetical protein